MRAFFLAVVFLIYACPSFAAVKVKDAVSPRSACTKDINPWGYPSICQCEQNYFYSQQIGLCLPEKLNKQINLFGFLHTDIHAIGGETTGFVLDSDHFGFYELILNPNDKKSLKQKSQLCEVTGIPITFEYLERGDTPAFIVYNFECMS